MDTLTEEEILYLKYLLADGVSRKRHNKIYVDNKREYYYELGLFGKSRLESLEKIEMAGKEGAVKAIE